MFERIGVQPAKPGRVGGGFVAAKHLWLQAKLVLAYVVMAYAGVAYVVVAAYLGMAIELRAVSLWLM